MGCRINLLASSGHSNCHFRLGDRQSFGHLLDRGSWPDCLEEVFTFLGQDECPFFARVRFCWTICIVCGYNNFDHSSRFDVLVFCEQSAPHHALASTDTTIAWWKVWRYLQLAVALLSLRDFGLQPSGFRPERRLRALLSAFGEGSWTDSEISVWCSGTEQPEAQRDACASEGLLGALPS